MTSMWGTLFSTCRYKLQDIDAPDTPEIDDTTKAQFLKWLCDRQGSSYESTMSIFGCQVFFAFAILGIAIFIAMPDAWTKNNPKHEDAKLALSLIIKMICGIAVRIHMRYAARCTEDCSVGMPNAAKAKWTSNDYCWALVGAALWMFFTANFMFHNFTVVKNVVLNVKKPITQLVPDFAVTDAPLNTIAWNHVPFIASVVLFCMAMKQPMFMCIQQRTWALSAYLVDVVWYLAWSTPYVAIAYIILRWLEPWLKCFHTCKRIWNESFACGPWRACTSAAPGAAAGTGVKATEDNVKTLPDIAEYGGPRDAAGNPQNKYEKIREIKSLTKYWLEHIHVDNRTATIDDINKAFNDSGTSIYCDDDGKKWFMVKEIERLGLNARQPKKKK